MTEQRSVDDVDLGDEVPAQATVVSPMQMFFFSAATYNGHRIHYDRPWATDVEGYRDIVVQGPLQVALIVRMVTDWIGGRGRLINLSVRNSDSAFAGDELNCSGRVVGRRRDNDLDLVDLEVRCETGTRLLVGGTATVCPSTGVSEPTPEATPPTGLL
jgi:acyl dehydratase